MIKKLCAALLIIVSCLVWAVPAQAATIPEGFHNWLLQTTTDTRKAWTVTFSAPMDPAVLKKSNFYITDNNNTLLSTTLTQSADGSSVLVKPVSAYIPGNKYWLFITGDITFEDGAHHLSKPIAMPFIVMKPDSKISSVTDNYSSLLTTFTVTTSSDVFSVKIDQQAMLYQGNNMFSLGVAGLKLGGKVTIAAYDSNGKLLQSQTYIIN